MNDLHIRFATPDDAGTIEWFIRELAVFERQPDAVLTSKAVIRAQLEQETPPFECLIAEVSDEAGSSPAGFALFFQNYSTWRGVPGLYLEDLFITESHRRQGVATALMRRLARIAVARGYARFEWAVLDWNRFAIELYQRIGARSMQTWLPYRLDGDALRQLATEEE